MKRNLQKILKKNLRWFTVVMLILSIITYLLRGFGLLNFLPGGVFLFLIIIAFFSSIVFLTLQTNP